MNLIAYRRKDQVHRLDLIGVGLIDATSPARFPPPPLAGKNDAREPLRNHGHAFYLAADEDGDGRIDHDRLLPYRPDTVF